MPHVVLDRRGAGSGRAVIGAQPGDTAAAPAATAVDATEAVDAADADAETNVHGTRKDGVGGGARRGTDTRGAAEGARAAGGGGGGSGDGGLAGRRGGG